MIIKNVGDIVRAGAALQVTCLNCARERFIKARFLLAKYQAGYPLEWLKPRFRCSRCQGRNVRLGLATSELAEQKLGRMEWFGGVYEKYDD